MNREQHRAQKGADPSSLLPPDLVEKSQMIINLKAAFAGQLPSRFGNVRTYISPVPLINSAIRADCQNSGCGVRAFVHIQRVKGEWIMVEIGPQFDRPNNKCSDCAEMFK